MTRELTFWEAAEYLDISVHRFFYLVATDQVPYAKTKETKHRIKKNMRFTIAALKAVDTALRIAHIKEQLWKECLYEA